MAGLILMAEEIMKLNKGLFSIIIVGIDDSEGTMHQLPGGQYSLTGTPGFGPSLGHSVASRNGLQTLEGISHRYTALGTNFFNPIADYGSEIRFNILSDDENKVIEAGLKCIINGIIHNDFAIGAYWLQLLNAATKSGSDACSHDNQCCIHVDSPFVESRQHSGGGVLMKSSMYQNVHQSMRRK